MFHLIVFAFLLAVGTASEDLEAEESVPPVQVYSLDEVHHHQHDGHHKQRPYNVYLDGVQAHKGQSKIDRIVTDFNNPDYIEPITVLDYRYLKTGGRDYTRGAGGQILILPKNVRVNQKKEFENYDEMLEFLRLKQLAEIEAYQMELNKLGYEHRHQGYHKHRVEITGHPHHDHREHDHRQYDHRQYHGHGISGGYKRDADEPSITQESAEKQV